MVSKQEIRTHSIKRYGWVPDLPDARDYMYAAPVEMMAKLPAKVDLRSHCPPVYDQGQLGSCTGNAIAGAVQFDREKQKLKPDFVPSRLFIYYGERVIEGTVNSDAGAQIRDGIKVVAKQGVPPETDWPYDIAKFADKPPPKAFADALKDLAVSYSRVSQTLSQMKGCLASGFPSCSASRSTTVLKARTWRRPASCQCQHLARACWAATRSWLSAMTMVNSASS